MINLSKCFSHNSFPFFVAWTRPILMERGWGNIRGETHINQCNITQYVSFLNILLYFHIYRCSLHTGYVYALNIYNSAADPPVFPLTPLSCCSSAHHNLLLMIDLFAHNWIRWLKTQWMWWHFDMTVIHLAMINNRLNYWFYRSSTSPRPLWLNAH